MKKIIFISIIIFLIFILLVFISIKILIYNSIPKYKNLNLKGLKEEVSIIIDSAGVPHIYATNQHDLYYSTGYIMAQHRLWQMDLLRRVTTGKLSEIFGKKYLEIDLLLRSLEFSKRSEKIYNNLPENIKISLIAFSNGINDYILKNKNHLPFEFKLLKYTPELWNPIHSLNLIGYMAWDLKAGWNEIILEKIKNIVDEKRFKELFQDSIFDKKTIFNFCNSNNQNLSLTTINNLNKIFKNLDLLDVHIFDASNNWAVSSQKTLSGKPILANDMHLSLNIPGIWFQIHQVIKDSLNVTGVAIPGQPLVICGHNEKIAWGMTNTYVDNVDFYLIKTDKNNPNKYFYNNKYLDITKKLEKIAIKNNDTVIKEINFTKFGPIISPINYIDSGAIAMHWIGQEEGNEYLSIYKLNRANNWTEFLDALKNFIAVSQNIAYADIEGNIGLVCAGGVPYRKRDKSLIILPGDTNEFEWKKILNIDSLPKIFNPSCSYVASANNKTISNYKYHIGSYYSTPYRFERITDFISSKNKLTTDDFKNLQNDVYSIMAYLFKKNIFPIINNCFLNDKNKDFLKELKNWNCEMNKSSKAALIFEIFTNNLIKNIFIDELNEDLFKDFIKNGRIYGNVIYRIYSGHNSEWIDNIKTSKKEDVKEIVSITFRETIDIIEKKYKDKNWGDIHKLFIKHPMGDIKIISKILKLKYGPIKLDGSYHTVKVFSYNENYTTSFGASNRHIYDLSDWDKSIFILPTGNSGIPFSKFYCNLTYKYINGEYMKMPFSHEKVNNYMLYNYKLQPNKK